MHTPTHRGLTRYDAGMLLVCCIWGANYSITKHALAELPPLPFAALRYSMSSVLLLLLVRWLEPGGRVTSRGAVLWLVGLGLLGNGLNPILFLLGLERTSATNTALIFASLPALVAVFGVMFGVEVPHRRTWLGIAIATVGVVMVVTARGVEFSSRTVVGDVLNLTAAVLWALFTVGLRRISGLVSPLRTTALTTLVGAPGLVLVAIPTLPAVRWTEVSPGTWLALLYATVL